MISRLSIAARLLVDRTMAFRVGGAWRWARIKLQAHDLVSGIIAGLVILAAYGITDANDRSCPCAQQVARK